MVEVFLFGRCMLTTASPLLKAGFVMEIILISGLDASPTSYKVPTAM